MRFVPFLLILATIGLVASCSDDDNTSNGTDPGKPPCAPCAVVYGPDMDNTMYQNLADTSNGAGLVMIVGNDGVNATKRGLIRFDVSRIPTGSRIDSVQVRMRTVTFNGEVVTVGLHRATAAWGEGTSAAICDIVPCDAPIRGDQATPGDATWVNRLWPDSTWASAGGDFVANASQTTIVGGAFVTYRWLTNAAMVTDVQGWVDDPSTNYGWTVIGDETRAGTHKWFGTREIPEEALRPEIVVHYSD